MSKNFLKIVVGWALVIFFIATGLIFWRGRPSLPTNVSPNTILPTSKLVYSPTEVAKHNTRSDCWLIIEKKVHKVTRLAPKNSWNNFSSPIWCHSFLL